MDGTPFGRYRLIEMLGRGGMGEVWRAYDTETKRTVAIKVLPPYLADNKEFVQRFRREAEAAAQLCSTARTSSPSTTTAKSMGASMWICDSSRAATWEQCRPKGSSGSEQRNSDSLVTLGYRTLRLGLFRGQWTGSRVPDV